jgi:DNA-binding transcriptional MerR regulator
MLTVNELAEKSNSPAHMIRYGTRIELIKPAAQQQNGYRLFADREMSPVIASLKGINTKFYY